MAGVGKNNQSSSIRGIGSSDGSVFLLSDRLASLNFNGFIPRSSSEIYASDLTIGQTIFSSDPSSQDNSFFITRIDSVPVTVEGVEENAYLLYFLGDNNLEEQYVYGAENEDGSFSQNHLFSSYRDDISNLSIGTDGWMITNQGNAVFSNVFVRGAIEATSGKIDGILTVGETTQGNALVTIGKNIFNSSSFEGSTSEHSGIFLNENNYLMGYEDLQPVPILSIVAENSTDNLTLRKAVFTLPNHTLSVKDKVSISGFTEDKFLELDDVFVVQETTTNTFTVYYKNEIVGTTNPISVNLKVDSYALNNVYAITELNLSSTNSTENTSNLKIYIDKEDTDKFNQGDVLRLSSVTNPALTIGERHIVNSITVTSGDENPDYLSISTSRVVAGTYTTDVGQINLYNQNHKFKVGNENNSMSYNSFTGDLIVTGKINANSGNFTNIVTVGRNKIFYSINRKELTNNVAKLATDVTHNFIVGDVVTITGVDSTFNGTYTITGVPTLDTFIYNKTATNVNSTAVSPLGTVSIGQPQDGSLVVGYGANQITIDGTSLDTTSAIYAGAGNYGNSDTGFFMDASGRFSLKDKLTFTSEGDLTVSGTVNANAGNFTGFVTAGNMKIGKDVESTNDGMYINSTNYWYDDGKFSLGSGTKKIYFDGTDVKITSDVVIEGGLTTTSLTVGTSPNQVIISPTAVSGNPGIAITGSGDFIRNTGAFQLGTSTGISYSGTNVNFGSNIKISGNIQTTGKIYSGTLDGGGTLTSGVEVSSTGIKGIISGVTAFNLPADGVTKPTITNFDVLNAKITGSGANAYLIAGTISDNITVRGDKTGVDATGAIFNTVSNTPTTFASGTGFYLNESGFFKIGSITSNAKFDPTANGGSGIFSVTGQINATSGYIGGTASGWLIDSELLSNSNVGFFAPETSSLRENLLTMPSFEQTAVWVADLGGTTAGPSSLQKRSGTNSFIIYSPVQTTAGVTSPSINVTAGQIYAMSAYALAQATPVGTKFLIVEISWFNSSNALISTVTSSQASLNTSTWTRASVAQAAPTGATTAKVRVAITGSTNFGSDRYYIDDALFEKQTTLSPIGDYFDGSYDNAFWTGVANNSTSKTSAVAIYAGSTTKETAPFRVTYDGLVTMTNANITGKLTSGTGSYNAALGNGAYGDGLDGIKLNSLNAWYMYDDSQSVSLRGKTVFMVGGPNGIVYNENAGTLNIGVDATFAGELSAATGTFSGALSGGTISIGSGNSIFKADTNGIYLGNAVFASAPFRVTPAGALTATNANITGTITATSGSFTGTVNAASGSFSGFMTTASGARFGTNVSSTNDGLYLNANNYFMTNGTATLFRAGTSTNFLQMNSTDASTRLQIDTTNSTYAVEVGGSVRVNGTLAYFYGDLIGNASSATNAGALDSLDSSAFLRSNASDSWAAATLTFTPTGAGAGLVFDAGFSDTTNDPVLVSNGAAHAYGRIGRPGNRMYAGYFSILYASTTQITSDIREKKDIENSDLGLDFINMLRPVKYKMINGIKKEFDSEGNQLENTPGTRWHYGLIAQELKQTLDTYGLDSAMWSIEDFETNPDGKQAISYNQVVSPLIKAVQELSETIQVLENRLAALES